jgi:Flp pilus assembly protein protease CpaA
MRLWCLLLTLFLWIFLIIKDERCQIIPVGGIVGFLVTSGVHLCFTPVFWESVCLLGGGSIFVHKPLSRWLKRRLLGEGDVKLFCLCGLWIPVKLLPIFLMIVGSVGCLRCIITHKRQIPFALPIFCGWLFCACKTWWQECGVLYIL